MRFKFCGDADCPDWLLAEIYNLSKISSIKLKTLAQVVARGILNAPIDLNKAENIFTESKLDATIDLKSCIACITFIINSTIRFNCDHNAMHSELQQLGLPREHSSSLKRVLDEFSKDLANKLKSDTLKVNALEEFTVAVESDTNCINMVLKINGTNESVVMTPYTLNVLLDNLKATRNTMAELNNAPFMLH